MVEEPPSETPDTSIAALPDEIEEQVLDVLELPDAERDIALEELYAAHPEHVETIRRWLKQAEESAEHARLPADPDPTLPDDIGPYRVLSRLGKGGFGTVYRAEQVHPIRREVAVKVINPGMDSGEILARFAAEREALNLMDHPGIARLLDAGVTDEGRPYFVMELVHGVPMHRFCKNNGLDLRARIELFLEVLDAVQHAHQKAVIHRDLSQNNVLIAKVDDQARPKIIDFGIAKSLAGPLAERALQTMQGQFLGTPEFMSPEQARGSRDIDTRTDTYALGVQLYELLSDTLPIPSKMLRGVGLRAMEEAICDYRPPRPSQRVDKHRARQLYGDLDWIAMKAIAKDRDLRYGTAGELAADLRRHLADEPVTAGPPSTGYILRKLVRRYRIQVAAGATVLLGLMVSLAIALLFLNRAQQAEQRAIAAGELAEEKADAGFKLLANNEQLQEALETESGLYPPWPDKAPAMRRWLATLAEPLPRDLPKMRRKLEELQQRAEQGLSGRAQQHLYNALTRLEADVERFTAAGGPLESMRERLAWAETVQRRSIDDHRAVWDQASEAIKSSDGVRASTRYRGLQIGPQVGLVPLGMNPNTGLWEFLHLRSAAPGGSLPDRDPDTGELRIGPESGIVFVLVPGGQFWMGARTDEEGLEQNDPRAEPDELFLHTVMLEPWFLSKYEMTQEQWQRLSHEAAPNRYAGSLQPVENVDWERAEMLMRQNGLTLPTEAQWEYACRAGTTTVWSWGDKPGEASSWAWLGPEPGAIGRLQPNPFGLFDTHGNVAEWCLDWYGDYAESDVRPDDGLRLVQTGPTRAVRGGACLEGVTACRAANRESLEPTGRNGTLGVRPARRLWRY